MLPLEWTIYAKRIPHLERDVYVSEPMLRNVALQITPDSTMSFTHAAACLTMWSQASISGVSLYCAIYLSKVFQ